MNYQEALDYLYSFLDSEAKLPRRSTEFNLPRTRALLDAMGAPDHALRCVVIAGTKGKGSTAAMLESVMRAAGYRTGLWTSPHLHTYRERIQVDRTPISREQLIALVAQFRPTLDAFDAAAYGQPSVFEVGFVLALHWFATHQVDVAILEIGLGGRYDSANAVEPVLSIITSISYDHMAILGNTLGAIAYEKAGIARAGVPLLTGIQPAEAQAVIAQVAQEVGAPLAMAGAEPPQGVPIGLGGQFQQENAAIVQKASELLREQGFVITGAAIHAGLAGVSWPGRFEVVAGAPLLVLDGAHNGDSARRLAEALRRQFPRRRVVLVFGTTRDKDIARMYAELLPMIDALVLTRSRHPRAETSLAELAAQARPYLRRGDRPAPLIEAGDIPEALAEARALADPSDVIVVTGSLFVVAAAREQLGLAPERD